MIEIDNKWTPVVLLADKGNTWTVIYIDNTDELREVDKPRDKIYEPTKISEEQIESFKTKYVQLSGIDDEVKKKYWRN